MGATMEGCRWRRSPTTARGGAARGAEPRPKVGGGRQLWPAGDSLMFSKFLIPIFAVYLRENRHCVSFCYYYTIT